MKEKEALLYATMPEHKALVNKTKGFIRWALQRVENPYVACSFGKDSSVMLHLVLQEIPDIPVVFAYAEETFIIDTYESIINHWVHTYSINLHSIYCNRESILDRTLSTEKIKAFGNHSFVGIREEESKARRMSLNSHGSFFKSKEGKIRISPISAWGLNDIIAYTYANKIPILDTYKIFGFESRTTSAIPSIGRERMLSQLKKRDIDAFNKILKLMPDARFYI